MESRGPWLTRSVTVARGRVGSHPCTQTTRQSSSALTGSSSTYLLTTPSDGRNLIKWFLPSTGFAATEAQLPPPFCWLPFWAREFDSVALGRWTVRGLMRKASMSHGAVALLNVLTMLTVSLAMLFAASFSLLSRSYHSVSSNVLGQLKDLHAQRLDRGGPRLSVEWHWHPLDD